MRALVSNVSMVAGAFILPMSILWLVFVVPVLGPAGTVLGLFMWAAALLATVRATQLAARSPVPGLRGRSPSRR